MKSDFETLKEIGAKIQLAGERFAESVAKIARSSPALNAPEQQTQTPTDDFDTVYSPHRVSEATGLSLTTLWRLRRRGEFPEPIQLSPGRVGWKRSVLAAWLTARENPR